MVWSFTLLIITLWLIRRGWSRPSPRFPLLCLLLIALFVRLLPGMVLVQNSNYDIESYSLVANHVVAGEDVYSSPDVLGRHPYLPFEMYWMGLAKWISLQLHGQFTTVVKLLPIVADAIISLVIFIILRRSLPEHQAFFGSLVYALNPVPIMVSAYHGQFDSVALLFLVLGVWQASRSDLYAGGWMGLGILAKSWPVLALPSLIISFNSNKQRWVILITSCAVPILGVIVYVFRFHARFVTVILNALSYNHGIGVWGYTYLLRLLGYLLPTWWAQVFSAIYSNARFITLAILIVIWWLVARKEHLVAGVLTILVGFLAFTHAFAIQYLIWLIPFAILSQEYRWLWVYTLSGFSYMFLAYNTLILNPGITNLLPMPLADQAIIIPASLPVWLITVAWVVDRMKKVRLAIKINEELETASP